MSARIPLVSLAFDDVKGRPAVGCIHLAQWFPWARLLVLLLTGIDLRDRLIQATGDAKESAGTHDGPSMDFRTRALALAVILMIVGILRAAGARATWYRDWTGNKHIHMTLDCPCPSAADYQTRAVDRGRDGLANNGPDPHKAPTVRRNYATGLAYIKQEILMAATFPTAAEIAQAFLAEPVTANGKSQPISSLLATMAVDTKAQSVAVQAEKERDYAERDRDAAIIAEIRKVAAKVEGLAK